MGYGWASNSSCNEGRGRLWAQHGVWSAIRGLHTPRRTRRAVTWRYGMQSAVSGPLHIEAAGQAPSHGLG